MSFRPIPPGSEPVIQARIIQALIQTRGKGLTTEELTHQELAHSVWFNFTEMTSVMDALIESKLVTRELEASHQKHRPLRWRYFLLTPNESKVRTSHFTRGMDDVRNEIISPYQD